MLKGVGRTALAILALLSLSGSAVTSWSDGWVDGWVDSSVGIHSANWAGYLNPGGPVTSVTSTFNVPQASQRVAGQAEYASVWDGIGGASLSSTALVQAGIHIEIAPGGAARYSAFVEGVSVQGGFLIRRAPMVVRPGDEMTVTVTEVNTGQTNYRIVNQTTGQRFDQTYAFGGDSSSAQWIVEAPHINGTLATTPLLSPIKFKDTAITQSQFLLQITMSTAPPAYVPIYVPSPLAWPSDHSTGGQFTVCQAGVPCPPAADNGDAGQNGLDGPSVGQHGA